MESLFPRRQVGRRFTCILIRSRRAASAQSEVALSAARSGSTKRLSQSPVATGFQRVGCQGLGAGCERQDGPGYTSVLAG